MRDRNGAGDAVRDDNDPIGARPPLPALVPEQRVPVGADPWTSGPHAETAPGTAPGWASWLAEETVPQREPGEEREFDDRATDLLDDDPMAPLVYEARRRAEATRQRLRARNQILAVTAATLVVALIAGAVWLKFALDGSATPAAAPTTAAAAPQPTGNQPGLSSWCQHVDTPDRVTSAGTGDMTSATGAILHLEYAWYVLRDATAVRSMLTPDVIAASEEATRQAISDTPVGTQHCVTISGIAADRWTVTVDERHPDGSTSSWQQIMTTSVRNGQVRISSIVVGNR